MYNRKPRNYSETAVTEAVSLYFQFSPRSLDITRDKLNFRGVFYGIKVPKQPERLGTSELAEGLLFLPVEVKRNAESHQAESHEGLPGAFDKCCNQKDYGSCNEEQGDYGIAKRMVRT